MSKDVEQASLSYRVPAGLKQALQELADADRRRLGPDIRLTLEAHVEQKRKEGEEAMNVTMGREFARQMETTGGPIDIDEVQRKFPTRSSMRL